MMHFEEEEERFISGGKKPLYKNFQFLTLVAVVTVGILTLLLLLVILTQVKGIKLGAERGTTTSQGTTGSTTTGDPDMNDNLVLRELSQSILGAIDFNADPCVDFYQYACGKWMENTPLPDDEASKGKSFSTIYDNNLLTLKEILEEDWPLISPLYQSCMDLDAVDSRGSSPILPILSAIDSVNDFPSLVIVLANLHQLGVDAFFAPMILADFMDPNMMIFHIYQGGLGLPNRDYYFATDSTSLALVQTYNNVSKTYLTLIGETASNAEYLANQVYQFEKSLASVSITPEEERDPYAIYHMMTIAQLQGFTPNLPWNSYFSQLNVTISQLNNAIPNFTMGFYNLVGSSDYSIVRAYLKIHTLQRFASYLSKDFRDNRFAWISKIYGTTTLPPRWKTCSSYVDRTLGELLGRYFVDRKFPGNSKVIARQLVDALESAFATNVADLTWMDQTTRTAALNKLNAFTEKIGYPDKWTSYDNLYFQKDQYFQNELVGSAWSTRKVLDSVGKPVDKSEWGMSPPTVNAYYNPSANEIVFPAGILQPPFFNQSYPAWANFGAIGSVIGHEITHGFDDQGRLFAADGSLTNWWTDSSAAAFETKAQCVIDTYDSYEVLPGVHINGRLTEGENLADLGGVRISYLAYKNWVQTKGDLYTEAEVSKYFPEFTADQLFFVSYGQVWCEVASDEYRAWLAQTNPHSDGKFRVIGATSNNNAFWEAFNCPAGSQMHPQNSCKVW